MDIARTAGKGLLFLVGSGSARDMKHLSKDAVAVAVSGGADSLYALLMLRELGFEPIAIHGLFAQQLDLGTEEQNKRIREQSGIVIERLNDFCQQQGITFVVSDCSDVFEKHVIMPFVQAYAAGKTPNPCALCNAFVKLPILLGKARELGAAVLATGHYARLVHSGSMIAGGMELSLPTAGFSDSDSGVVAPPSSVTLLQGTDRYKDQSYFLSLVAPDILRHCMFPLGNAVKKEILATLERNAIQIPQAGESQEICFVPDDAYQQLLPRLAERFGISLGRQGQMRVMNGPVVGKHKGLWQYTEGQRKGLGIGWKEPLYVVAKDMVSNELLLSAKEGVKHSGALCSRLNFIVPLDQWPTRIFVKMRYRETPQEVQIQYSEQDDTMEIHVAQCSDIVAPGQIAAFYGFPDQVLDYDNKADLQLLGGGIIERNIW